MEANQKFPSIAHCAMHLIYNHSDWSNKKIADEVVRIMDSRTGPGNISWYKGKLKKGELKFETYLDFTTNTKAATEASVDNMEVAIPAELQVTEEDILSASGLQKMAFVFYKTRTEKSFNALYERLKPGMRYHALNMLKDEAATDDVVSIAFTKIWTKIGQYNKFWNFSTWAYRIVHNEAMQYIRKTKMLVALEGSRNFNHADNAQYSEHSLRHNGADEELVSTDPNWNVDEEIDVNKETYEKVINEIYEMSAFYKEIMLDRELDDMKYKDIAKKYGMKMNSVKTRIKRARMQIIQNNPEYYKAVQAKIKKNNGRIENPILPSLANGADLWDTII
jgi:RNA polymerase sigma-70 factor, ECF subfamily